MFYLNSDVPSHSGGPSPTSLGWIYLTYDYRHLDQTKIGLTTRSIFKRIRESTTNPYYALFAAFHVPNHSILVRIEKYLESALRVHFVRHLSNVESEWCMASPSDVLSSLVELLPNVLDVDCDEGDYDFTRTIYLPEVNPYEAEYLADEQMDQYIRFAAPARYLEELRLNYRRWDARPNFLEEIAAMGSRSPLTITGPQVLLDRVNYDLARRGRF